MLSLRQKASSIVLTGTLLAGVLVAAISAGYQATKVDLGNAAADLPRGNTVVTVNGETQRVEAEARALATGKDELEPVTLQDGRVAVVNHRTRTVELLPVGLAGQGPQIDRSGPAASPQPPDTSGLMVVQAKDAPYLIDPAKDIVESIDLQGQPQDPVVVPGGASAEVAPDVAAGVWIRSDDHKAVHVVRRDANVATLPDQVEHLTMAEGRPIVVTSTGAALDIAADPVAAVTTTPLPHGLTVLAGSHRGAGRYLVLIDRKEGKLVVVDPRTKSVREFTDLPRGGEHNLGAPVVLDDRVYVPDYSKHRLYVRDLAGNTRQEDVVVPGNSRFTVEVRDRRVWANDQYDRGAVTIGRDGRPSTVDKGSGSGVQSDTTPVAPPPGSTRKQAPPVSGSSPTPPRSTPSSAPAKRLVAVPAFPQGTPQTEACDQIRALSLRCEPVETGSDGPFGTIRDTDPAAGTRVPEQSVVRVRVYGPIPVPNVVGQRRSVACRQLEPALRCAEQPMPGPAPNRDLSQLDIVAEQDPAGGQRAERDSGVTVRYWAKTEMDNLVGKAGAAECNRIMTSTNNLVSCELRQGAEAPSPAQAGTITQQSVAAGAEVKIDDRVVLTIYQKQVPRVPSIAKGTPLATGCQIVAERGYHCVEVADAADPLAGVISQDPPGETPQEGGDVVLHYSPHASSALWLWRNTQFPDVHVIRLEGQTPAGYTQVKQLGRAYPPGTSTGFRHINGFTCVGTLTTCKGVSPNHYYTADTANPHAWQGPSPIIDLPPATNGACPARQRAISRYGRLGNDNNRYTVDFQAVSGYSLIEVLGCVWLP